MSAYLQRLPNASQCHLISATFPLKFKNTNSKINSFEKNTDVNLQVLCALNLSMTNLTFRETALHTSLSISSPRHLGPPASPRFGDWTMILLDNHPLGMLLYSRYTDFPGFFLSTAGDCLGGVIVRGLLSCSPEIKISEISHHRTCALTNDAMHLLAEKQDR